MGKEIRLKIFWVEDKIWRALVQECVCVYIVYLSDSKCVCGQGAQCCSLLLPNMLEDSQGRVTPLYSLS